MSVRQRVQQRRFTSAADEAMVSLMVAADRVEQAFEGVFDRHGITGEQYNVLRILRGVYPRGHARGEVAQRCIHRSPDMTRMLDRLVGRGLVVRAPDPDDRRCSVATVTKAGLALLARIDPELEAETRRLAQPLSRLQLHQLARSCDALVP